MNKFSLYANSLVLVALSASVSAIAFEAGAQEVDFYQVLSNSAYKSPNITWSTDGNTAVSIGDTAVKYTWASTDPSHGRYTSRQLYLSGDVVADFLGANVSCGSGSNCDGGGIFIGYTYQNYTYTNYGTNITSITGNFIGNRGYKGLPDNYSGSHGVYGGALYYWPDYDSSTESYYGMLSAITGDFVGNSAESHNGFVSGGAIYLIGSNDIRIHGNFIGNHVETDYTTSAEGGALAGQGTIKELVGNFIGNYAVAYGDAEGGAIYAGFRKGNGLEALSGDFIDNHVQTLRNDMWARGGAIYIDYSDSWDDEVYTSRVNLVADGSTSADNIYQQDVLFKGNYVQVGAEGEKKYEAIYNSGGALDFESRNGGSFTFYDYINVPNKSASINFVSDGNGVFNLYNNIIGSGVLNIKGSYVFNMVNNELNKVSGSSMTISAPSKLNIDVALSDGTSDSFNIYSVEGAENFSLDEINLLDDMPAEASGLRIKYAAKPLTGNVFSREQSTSNATYSIANDGQNLLVALTDKPGGYANFLADINNQGGERTYSFTQDENMTHILNTGKDTTGLLEGENADVTIYGNNHSLNNADEEVPFGIKTGKDQNAEIKDLTISGFATGVVNAAGGTLTLNNVTLSDNQTGLRNSGEVVFKGENTISGGENAMFVDAVKSTDFPLFAVYTDYMLGIEMGELGISSYAELEEKWPELVSSLGIAEAGIDFGNLDITDFSNMPAIEATLTANEAGIPMTAETTEFDIVSTVLARQEIEITQEDYDNFLAAMKNVAEEYGPGYAVQMLSMAINGKIYYTYDEFIEGMVARELSYSYTEAQLANLSAEELEEAKNQIKAQYAGRAGRVDALYEQYGIPNPEKKFADAKAETVLTFVEDAVLNLNSKIDGEEVYGLTFKGAKNAVINLNSTIEKADFVLDGPVLKLQDEGNLAALNSFVAESGFIDTQNGVIGTLVLPNFTVSRAIDLYVDADLARKKMDQIKVVKSQVATSDTNSMSVENEASGVINLAGIKLLSDAKEAKTTVELFVDKASKEALKDQVVGAVKGISYSPIYKYDAAYNAKDGTVTFTRLGGAVDPDQPHPARHHPSPKDFNPLLYSASVSNIVAGFVQSAISNTVFANALPQGISLGLASGDAPKFGNTWISVLTFDDDVDIKHFETVDSKVRSVVGGVNSNKISLGYGQAVWGMYAGYLNGTQKFTLNKIEQNGGYAGVHAKYEQNKMIAAATTNIGFIKNEDKNPFGKDKFNTYWTGLNIKGGYNQALGYGFILLPNLQFGYTYVNTETYTTKAGVKMKNDVLHLWEASVGAELSKAFGNAWRGFAHAKYTFVAKSGGDVQANDTILPHVSNKNYAEYGLGIEKALCNKWKLATEVNRHEGGRKGWNIRFDVKFDL